MVIDNFLVFQFHCCIHSVLGDKAECPRAQQLLNEVTILIRQIICLMRLRVYSFVSYYTNKDSIYQTLWRYPQRTGSRGRGDEEHPWISLRHARLHLQKLGKASDQCFGGNLQFWMIFDNLFWNQPAWLPLWHSAGWDHLQQDSARVDQGKERFSIIIKIHYVHVRNTHCVWTLHFQNP